MASAAEAALVSIVVPVYNVESELDRCVESLLRQTLSRIEIILVDDGSTDKSGLMCDEWSRKDSRIKVVHKTNGGLSSARNIGLAVSSCDYVGFVDSDDYVDQDMFDILFQATKRAGKDIASCGRYVHMGDAVKLDFVSSCEKVLDVEAALREVLLGNDIDVSACDKLYRKSLFMEVEYPEGRINEDAAVILQIIDSSNGVVCVNRPLYHYCYRDNSISKSNYGHSKYDVVLNCNEMRDFLTGRYPLLLTHLNSYICTQMAGLIEGMICSPGSRKKFAQDYADYWDLFKASYPSYRKVGNHSRNEELRILMTRIHCYRLFSLMRTIWSKVRER